MKKLINGADDIVAESLGGRALLQPGVALVEGRDIVVLADRVVDDHNRASVPVALLSGGGAGHEPAHAGYVAEGMLTAAVSGGVFSSPSVDDVLDGIRTVTGDAGCLLIVKSYTGDRLNFGMAAELARDEGLDVEMVVVGDDVALGDDDSHAGRRGLAGTVLVHKVAGARAAQGGSLAEVAATARRVADAVGTMGVGLTPVTTPAAGSPAFELGDDEIELGLGIHGEPGVERVPMASADALAERLVETVLADRGIGEHDRVVALVGSAGATPPSELDIMARGVFNALRDRGVTVARLWAGPVMTSLDMAGASVTLLAVDEETLSLLDAPTTSPAWPATGVFEPRVSVVGRPALQDDSSSSGEPDERVRAIIDAVCRTLLDARADLDAADQNVGDGDLGSALARGAQAWLDDPAEGSDVSLLDQLSQRARRAIGGTSGPLYGMLLLRAAHARRDGASWVDALAAGVDGVRELGGAAPGDGTMVDALQPAADAARSGASASEVVEAAKNGARSTAEGTSSKGRASYVGDRARGYEDPGATAVGLWLDVVATQLDAGAA